MLTKTYHVQIVLTVRCFFFRVFFLSRFMSNFPKLNEAGREEKESEHIFHVIFFLNEMPILNNLAFQLSYFVMRLLGNS